MAGAAKTAGDKEGQTAQAPADVTKPAEQPKDASDKPAEPADKDKAKEADNGKPKEGKDFVVSHQDPLGDDQVSEYTTLRAGMTRNLYAAAGDNEPGTVNPDGMVKGFKAQVFYGGKWKDIDGDGNPNEYVWTATSSNNDHHFNYRVSLKLDADSGRAVYKGDPNGTNAAVKIEVPSHILRLEPNGEFADRMEFAVPSRQDILDAQAAHEVIDDDIGFAWYQEDGHTYLYNWRDLGGEDGDYSGFMEMSYITTHPTFDYKDYDTEGFTERFKSDDFIAEMHATKTDVNNTANTTAATVFGRAANVYIDTQVDLEYANSRIPVMYDSWPWDKGDQLVDQHNQPINKDDYVYLMWEVDSHINDNSQEYYFQIADTYSKILASDGTNTYGLDDDVNLGTTTIKMRDSFFVAAAKFDGETGCVPCNGGLVPGTTNVVGVSDGVTVVDPAIQQKDGIRYDYVMMAMRADVFNKMVSWTFENRAELSVIPRDHPSDPDTYVAALSYSWTKPVFNGGGGSFGSWKWADRMYRYQMNRNAWPRTQLSNLGMVADTYSRYDLEDLLRPADENPLPRLDNLDYALGVTGYSQSWSVHPDVKKESGKDGKYYLGDDNNKQYIEGEELASYFFKEPVRYLATDDAMELYDETTNAPHNFDHRVAMNQNDYRLDTLTFSLSVYDRAFNAATQAFDKTAPTKYLTDDQANWTRLTGTGSKLPDVVQDEGEILIFRGKYPKVVAEGSTESPYQWVELARYDVKNKTFIEGSISNKISISGNKLTFNYTDADPVDMRCVGFQIETYNTHYYTFIGAVPSYSLYNGPAMTQVYREHESTADDGTTIFPTKSVGIRNQAFTDIYASSSNYQQSEHPSNPYDDDFVRKQDKQSQLDKKVVSSTNNAKWKQYTVGWRVDMQETLQSSSTESGSAGATVHQPIGQNGGTFYDLLPLGATLDPDSVKVQSEGEDLGGFDYTVEQEPDYKGTGQILVKVIVKPGNGVYEDLTVFYNTIHSYDAIRDYGSILNNYIAYQTGNATIADGQLDGDETKLKAGSWHFNDQNVRVADTLDDYPAAMKNLTDGTDSGKRLIYNEREYDLAAITAASATTTKKVLTANSADYDTEGITSNNDLYNYRVRFQNGFTAEAEGIILFDNLENLENPQKDSPTKRQSDWRGTLKKIVVEAQGLERVSGYNDGACMRPDDGSEYVEPALAYKLYVNESDVACPFGDLGYDEPFHASDLKAEDGWYVAGALTDYSKVKSFAIALDPSLQLHEGGSLTAHVYMQAPPGVAHEPGSGYPQAYNAAQSYHEETTQNQTEYPVIKAEVTTVSLLVYADVYLRKISTDMVTTVKDATFSLEGVSDYGTQVSETSTSTRAGNVGFKRIEKGTYTLQEIATTPDWQRNKETHKVQIASSGAVIIDGELTDGDGRLYSEYPYTVTNAPRVHGDLRFLKTDLNLNAIEGATFELAGMSSYGNPIKLTGTSNKLGIVAINNIEAGSYIMTEEATSADYVRSNDSFLVQVTGETNENVQVTVKKITEWEGTDDAKTPKTTVDLPLYPNTDDTRYITNTPKYWNLTVRKADALNYTRYLPGAVVQLRGAGLDDYKGSLEVKTDGATKEKYLEAESNNLGLINFPHLEAGTYFMKEVKAPTVGNLNFRVDPQSHMVTISETGVVTIAGLTEDDGMGHKVLPNERALSGQIVIYKQWEDDYTDDQRTKPQITLTAAPESLVAHKVVVTKEWRGDDTTSRPKDVDIVLTKTPKVITQGTGSSAIKYTLVPYVESTGSDGTTGAYVDTGIKPTGNTTVNCVFEFPSNATNTRYTVFGARNDIKAERFTFYDYWQHEGERRLYAMYGKLSSDVGNVPLIKDGEQVVPGHKYSVSMTPAGASLTDLSTKETVSGSYASQTFSVSRTMFVFGHHNSKEATDTSASNVRIYSFKMYDNGVLQRDYVPVCKQEGTNTTYGLYDLVSNEFFGNVSPYGSLTGLPPATQTEEYHSADPNADVVWTQDNQTGVWTCTFNGVEDDGTYDIKAYENTTDDSFYTSTDPEDRKPSVDDFAKLQRYTSTAPSAGKATAVSASKATITNSITHEPATFSYDGTTPQNGHPWVFTAAESGYYKLQVWGADGGCENGYGGLGGYSEGVKWLDEGEKLYVYVGARGNNQSGNGTIGTAVNRLGGWNGGGDAGSYPWSGPGGGATDIRTVPAGFAAGADITDEAVQQSNAWNNGTDNAYSTVEEYAVDASLLSRIIVAGGGGGAGNDNTGNSGSYKGVGGAGGGLEGEEGHNKEYTAWSGAKGGTQTGGYAFGRGQNRQDYATSPSQTLDGAGGGGGWYGGFAPNGDWGAGGGSGYVSPSLLNAITISGANVDAFPENKPEHRTTKKESFNGYAKITFVSAVSPNPVENNSSASGSGQGGGSVSTVLPAMQYFSEDNGWVSLGNGLWKYVFNVFDDMAKYTATEAAINGYTTYVGDANTNIAIINDNGVITKEATFINRKPAAYGKLTISKAVTGLDPCTQPFTFTVRLYDDVAADSTATDGSTVSARFSGERYFGNRKYVDGVTTVVVAAGSSITLTDLPAGAKYTVTEVSNENFTLDTEHTTGDTGIIVADSVVASGTASVSQASFTNAYVPPATPTHNVVLKKAVDNLKDYDKDKEFSFKMVVTEGLETTIQYPYVITEAQGADQVEKSRGAIIPDSANAGYGYADLKLKANQTATFYNIPEGAKFEFAEDAGEDYIASYKTFEAVTTDTGTNATTNNVLKTAAQNENANTSLVTEKITQGVNPVVVEFSNKLVGSQTLVVKKQLANPTDAELSKKFHFDITFSDLEKGAVIKSPSLPDNHEKDGTVLISVDLMHDESVTFTDLPVGAKYTVVEAGVELYKPSFVATVKDAVGDKTVLQTVSGSSNAANHALSTDQLVGTPDPDTGYQETAPLEIRRNTDTSVVFTNAKAVEPLVIKKTVQAKSDSLDASQKFNFQVSIGGYAEGNTIEGTLGTTTSTYTFDADGKINVQLAHNQQLTFASIPVGTAYTVTEAHTDGFFATAKDKEIGASVTTATVFEEADNKCEVAGTIKGAGSEVAFTNTKQTAIEVSKSWIDDEDRDKVRPGEVTVEVKKMVGDQRVSLYPAVTAKLNKDNQWKHIFQGLPTYDKEDALINYVVEETELYGFDLKDGVFERSIRDTEGGRFVAKYTPKVEPAKDGNDAVVADSYVITNTYEPQKVSVDVSKKWEDANNQDGMRPENVTVKLQKMQDEAWVDVAGKTATLTAAGDNAWKATFADLLKYENGAVIKYRVVETGMDGYQLKSGSADVFQKTVDSATGQFTAEYTASVAAAKDADDDDIANSFVITNTYEPKIVDVAAKKVWDDVNDRDGKRVGEVKFNVLADGVAVGSIELSAGEGGIWDVPELSGKVEGLPKYKDGKEIVYTVEEVQVPEGYQATYSGSLKDGFIVTNTHVPMLQLSGLKAWDDSDNAAGVRPDSVTVMLIANGDLERPLAQAKTTAADGWKFSFGELPMYKDGKMVMYTVVEKDVSDRYVASYAIQPSEDALTFTVTNKLVPVTPTPVPTPDPTPTPAPESELAKTSDLLPVGILGGVIVVAAIVVIVAARRSRKE